MMLILGQVRLSKDKLFPAGLWKGLGKGPPGSAPDPNIVVVKNSKYVCLIRKSFKQPVD